MRSRINTAPGRKGRTVSPVLDAFLQCAGRRLGVVVHRWHETTIQFFVEDLEVLLMNMEIYCTKANPTSDVKARLKALQRWFEGVPSQLTRDTFIISARATRQAKYDNTIPLLFETAKRLKVVF